MSVGFYGKLPSHGDFLQRGVRDDFVNRWDAWLQEGISRSRGDLGDAWLDVFLTSPLWRFALASGVIGSSVWAGILLPSVDRVGRYFPLTLVAELPPEVIPFELAVAGNGWFDWAEALARRTLDVELVDLDRFEDELRESRALLAGPAVPGVHLEFPAPEAGGPPARWFALGPEGDMGRFFARFAATLAAASHEPLGLWWSMGSERVAPSVLMTRGLPESGMFGDLLGAAGARNRSSMQDTIARETIPASFATPAPEPIVPPPDPAPTVPGVMRSMPAAPASAWRSAAGSDVGRVREENQDAFVERAGDGLWMVADGMGGHQGGRFASQLIADRIAQLPTPADLAGSGRAVCAAITAANAELRRCGEMLPGFDGGSTVVALLIHDGSGLCVWAGDSRLYRLRGGELRQLTQDHSVGEEPGSEPGDAHMLTRAVGGAELLALDELPLDVEPDDRFLLCSDGLYRDLTVTEMRDLLGVPDPKTACRGLIDLALERGGTDNATAIVVGWRASVA